MPISYTIDSARRVVLERWIGDIYGSDLSEHWRVMTGDPAAMGCRGSLADITECTFHIAGDELSKIIRAVVIPALLSNSWKAAILVNGPVQFGLARQYGAWTDDKHEMAIFSDRESALAWLLG